MLAKSPLGPRYPPLKPEACDRKAIVDCSRQLGAR